MSLCSFSGPCSILFAVQFKREFHAGLVDGSITITFRLWSRPHVRVGGRYRCHPVGMLEVDAIDRVRLGDVALSDARRAGFDSPDALASYLKKVSRSRLGPCSEVFRIALHRAGPIEDTTGALDADLSPSEGAGLAARLDKLDRLSRHGAWTRETLSLIADQPRVAASKLAPQVGREKLAFKTDVRKLKKLGLTISHEIGYEISPKGRAFLER